jgi:hypothetical protein
MEMILPGPRLNVRFKSLGDGSGAGVFFDNYT